MMAGGKMKGEEKRGKKVKKGVEVKRGQKREKEKGGRKRGCETSEHYEGGGSYSQF